MPISDQDREEAISFSKSYLETLKSKNIFISGATGFFGKWLMQILIRGNEELKLNLKISILTRNSKQVLLEQAWLNNSAVKIIEGDIRNFQFPSEKFDVFIHAATAASAILNAGSPVIMADTIIDGTRNILKLAAMSDHPRFLFISSGAVYGRQPSTIQRATENLETGPLLSEVSNAYAEGKRMAELYCQMYQSEGRIRLSIARCYAFLGPYLPLDQHFAVGNFIKSILEKKPIVLTGDGSPFRSYMYPTDLVEWLLAILTETENGEIFNVGSESEIQIKDLAMIVNDLRDSRDLLINQNGIEIRGTSDTIRTRNAYVPAVEKAKKVLNLRSRISLNEALQRTLKWNIEAQKNKKKIY